MLVFRLWKVFRPAALLICYKVRVLHSFVIPTQAAPDNPVPQSTVPTARTEQEEQAPLWGLLSDCLPSGQGESVNTCFLSHWTSDSKNARRSQKVKVKSLSRVQLFATPWTVAYQASPFTGFSRQDYQSGLPFPSLRTSQRWSKDGHRAKRWSPGTPPLNWDRRFPWVTPLLPLLETGCLLPTYIPFSLLRTSRQDWANISAWFQNNSALLALLELGESSVPIPQREAKGEQPQAYLRGGRTWGSERQPLG